MTTPIFVPSRSRSHRVGTIVELQPVIDRVTLVCPCSQTDEYRDAIRGQGLQVPQIEGVPDEWRIGETRLYCGTRAKERGERRFGMIDDDIGFLIRKSDDAWNLRALEPSEVGEMLDFIDSYMDKSPSVCLMGVSPREGNNNPGVGSRDDLVERCERIHRSYFWDTAEFLSLRHLRIPVAEDFDLALQSLRRGSMNALTYWYAQGQRTTQDEGGASDYRSLEVHNAAVEELARLHPGFVEVVEQRKRGGGELAHRKESRIAWKRAAKW